MEDKAMWSLTDSPIYLYIYIHMIWFTSRTSLNYTISTITNLLDFQVHLDKLPVLSTQNHGFPFASNCSSEETSSTVFVYFKPVSYNDHRCPKRPPCSLRWRKPKKEICDSSLILEPFFISRLAKSSWRRIWIRPSNGRFHYTLQRRHLHWSHFSDKHVMRDEGSNDRFCKHWPIYNVIIITTWIMFVLDQNESKSSSFKLH